MSALTCSTCKHWTPPEPLGSPEDPHAMPQVSRASRSGQRLRWTASYTALRSGRCQRSGARCMRWSRAHERGAR
jgi:hypothetical protein